MAGIKDRLVRQYRRRWAIAMVAILVVVIGSLICLELVRRGQLTRSPWQYVAMASAVLAGLFGTAMMILESWLETNLTSRSVRMERARRLRRRNRRSHGKSAH